MLRNLLHILFLMLLLVCASHGVSLGQRSNLEVIDDIRNAYENLDLPVAEARIEAALQSFDQFTPEELGEIYTLYALIFFARDDQEGTRRQLDLALQINPNIKLALRDTPPQVITILEELIRTRSTQRPADSAIRYLVVQDPRPAAVLRSMVLPGWGQLHKQQKKKGIVLMAAWGVTSIGTVVSHVKRRQAEDHYLASLTLDQINNRYPDFNNWHRLRNNFFVTAAGVWVFSYIDALLQHPSSGKDLPIQITFSPVPNSQKFVIQYTF